jgi:hypothetical protein
MTSNSPEQIRERLYEEYEDSLFKLIMHDAAAKEGRLFLEEKKQLAEDPASIPSPQALRQFKRQLAVQLRKKKIAAARKRVGKLLNRTAVAVLAAAVFLFVTVANVQALRVRVLNLLVDIQPQYTSFRLNGDEATAKESAGNSPNSVKSAAGSAGAGDLQIGWSNAYVPTYVPDGYQVSSIDNKTLIKKIVFQNPAKDSTINYMEFSEDSNLAVDTENAVVKPVNINGNKGRLIEKNSLVTAVWAMDNRMFLVQAPLSAETVLKIAEGVKYVQ